MFRSSNIYKSGSLQLNIIVVKSDVSIIDAQKRIVSMEHNVVKTGRHKIDAKKVDHFIML